MPEGAGFYGHIKMWEALGTLGSHRQMSLVFTASGRREASGILESHCQMALVFTAVWKEGSSSYS